MNYTNELQKYRERKKMRHSKYPIDWRPDKSKQAKYTESPVYKNGNRLRTYQLEGVNWLINRWYWKTSCIMADEMGLGKTVQSVCFVDCLSTEFQYNHPVIVIAPLSTLVHWEREFKAWTDLRVLTYHGTVAGREMLAEYEFTNKTGNINVRLFDVILTTYEMAMSGMDHLSQFEYSVGIVDEAHRLKNPKSKAARSLNSLKINHKVLLTGTPIQNNLSELWALFNFMDSSKFSSLSDFLEEYKLNDIKDVEKLQELLKPLMLRRMKEDVETTIPQKEETIIEVELTIAQKRYYRAILEKNFEFLVDSAKKNVPNLINAMMELRKCCIHPYLLK
ncbi:chromodomain DNA_Bprt, partial [Enterospora canceri]